MKEKAKAYPESGFVFDERDGKLKVAYETRLRRLETVEFVKNILFNSAGETYTSKVFECAPFKKFLLFNDIVVTGAPTTIQIWVEFSHNNAGWFKLMDGPFGSLMYEDSAGDKKECVQGKICAHWMRLHVVSVGCDASKTFKLSANAELSA